MIYGHSGDIGDIIYSLPVVQALGRGEYRLRKGVKVRDEMMDAKAASIGALLRIQPYIAECVYSERIGWGGLPEETHNLDRFRRHWNGHSNIALAHCREFLVPFDPAVPWLRVDKPITVAPIVVARSLRYRNGLFPWANILKRFQGQMVFVGNQEEYTSFRQCVGEIPFHPTTTLLELAQVIAGSSLFIGNQSAPYAIAEGLKVATLQECWLQCTNVIFERPNAIYFGDRMFRFDGGPCEL